MLLCAVYGGSRALAGHIWSNATCISSNKKGKAMGDMWKRQGVEIVVYCETECPRQT
jgi:hypothetical protein